MSNNLYDAAYELEKAIRESEEYEILQKVYNDVHSDEPTRKMFESFRDIQLGLQEKQMMGQEITEEEVQQAQKTVELVQQNEQISKLMEAEQRMGMIISELNQIIIKPLDELYQTEK